MGDEIERRVPTSRELGGADSGDGSDGDVMEMRPSGVARLLNRFGLRRGARERRTEVEAPTLDVSSARSAPPEANTGQSTPAESGSLEDEAASGLPEAPTKPASSRNRTGQKRGKGLGITRIGDVTEKEDRAPSQPSWWPQDPNVAKKLERAIDRGHVFDGVAIRSRRTKVWKCVRCPQSVQLVFEQDDMWAEGIGNYSIKADATGWDCHG